MTHASGWHGGIPDDGNFSDSNCLATRGGQLGESGKCVQELTILGCHDTA